MASPPPSSSDPTGGACPHCGEPHPGSYTHCPKTGKPLTSGRALIGRVIAGRYRIIGLLGEGGMGAVYVAEHTLIGRKVAIKRLHPELAADEKAVQRFQREARAAASTGHEHIVEILDLGYAEDGAPYLVMEYLRGQSLATVLRKEQRIDSRRACFLVGQMLAALEPVHKHHIVHRDLKPDNVFLTRRNGQLDYVKILDFGISKMKKEEGDSLDLTRTGVMLGTPFYMSPEQARGMKNLDHRVDLYACGVILFECVTGRVPYEGDNYHQLLQAILRQDPPTLRSLGADVDPALEAIVMRAIAKDPANRFPSAAAMLGALLPHGAEAPSLADNRESGEGASMSVSQALHATTPVAPEHHLGAATPEAGVRDPGVRDDAGRGAPGGAEPASGEVLRRDADLRAARTPPQGARDERPRGGVDPAATAAATPVSPASRERISRDRRASARGLAAASRSPLPGTPAALSSLSTPSGVTTPIGPRYFFAASDDWDESRARAVVDNGPRGGSAFRDPPPGPRDRDPAPSLSSASGEASSSRESSGREPSGPFAREAPPVHREALSGSLGFRESASASRDGPRLLTPIEPEPEPGAVREPMAMFVSGGGAPLPADASAARYARGEAAPAERASFERAPERTVGDRDVKGSLVVAALEHLETTHGRSAMGRVRAQLDPETERRFSNMVLPMEWVPLAQYEQLLRAAERVVGAGEGTTSQQIGRATAERELPTVHRLFMQSASPAIAAERIPQLYRSYHARGEARVSPTPGAGVRVEIDSGAPESLLYAWTLAGFWGRMLELVGGRDVRASVVSCRSRGDERTAITFRWR
jgi:tRNA A-37 threonylcarbamoyl transferase component Bud32